MRRRDFIALLAGAAAAWPLAARAQQGERMRRIGVLMNLAADDPESPIRLAALLQALPQLCWGAGNADLMRKHARELAALAPDVILARSSAAVAPLLEATRTVPIVFAIVA